MEIKYHYDRYGRYTGKTVTRDGDDGESGCGCLILIIVFLLIIGGC